MAETFLEPVITKLIDILAEEVKSLKGVRKQVKSLQDELEFIQPLLKHAEAKLESREMRDVMQVWVKQVRKEANRIEEIIDEFLYFVEAEKHHRQSGCISCFHKACGFVKDLKQRHDIASKIKDVKDSLRDIKERGQGYGMRPLEQGASSTTTNVEAPIDPRLGSLFIEKEEFVGLETESEALIRKLVGGSSATSVISLVGQGGIGKTTLAKKVYDEEIVKGHFELHAWVTVSQSYDVKKLLKNLKGQICTSERGKEETDKEVAQHIQDLRNSLGEKSYVVVFDDVWQENFWAVIKSALPNYNKGSRIVITTRNVGVAKSSPFPCDLVRLQTWSLKSAWELFCKKAFYSEFQGRCPQDLQQLSLEIVRKCQGLPLVIATIAGLLSTKEKVELEWQRVLDDLNSKSEMNSELNSISEILSLSYYDLPSHLKSCFLYFGIFPEDYSIEYERLYRLWIAEGFIIARGEMILEEVAEAYLKELVQRNLVAIGLLGDREHKKCRVHDLMHDVILSRANEVCFSRTLDGNKSRGAGRRLRISGSIENVLKNVGDSPIRSLFFSDIDEELTESFIVTLFKKFKLLEVLDFEGVHLNILPQEVENLFLLKYLNLKHTKVNILPKSIKLLQKLQSLDIRETLIRELPVEINELRNLRHLLAYKLNLISFDYNDGVRMHEGFGNLEELQSLTLFEAHHGGIGLVKELEKLRKLRWLDVSKLTSKTWRGICASIRNMDHLQRLALLAKDENEVLDLEYISSPPRFLRELSLIGRLQNLPDTIPKFRNLCGLKLNFSCLADDPCKYLKVLPNLETLGLTRNAFKGEELHFEKGVFEKLKELSLHKLDGLKHIEIDEGALPALEMLDLWECTLLKEVPSVKHLTKLKHLEIDGRRVLKWN